MTNPTPHGQVPEALIDLIGEPDTERLRTVRRVLRGAVIVAEEAGEAATAPQPAPATQQAGDVVAYLDVGAGGYLDLGSELSEDALQQLPKGRHALVIAGTYGIDGYVAAPQPSPTTKPAPQPAPAPLSDEVVRDAAFEAVRKKLCTLPRYSFVLDDDGLVRRAPDRTGNWIEFDEAHALFDPVSVEAALAAQGGK